VRNLTLCRGSGTAYDITQKAAEFKRSRMASVSEQHWWLSAQMRKLPRWHTKKKRAQFTKLATKKPASNNSHHRKLKPRFALFLPLKAPAVVPIKS